MKTVIVVSDSHGNRRAIDSLDGVMAESDYVIHLGDTSGDGDYIRKKYPDKTFVINGNCDIFPTGQDELVLEIEKVRILAVHGHKFGVKSSLTRLCLAASEKNCSVALYGHSHSPREDSINGILLCNPGTLSKYSRQSYGYLVINGDKAVFKNVFING